MRLLLLFIINVTFSSEIEFFLAGGTFSFALHPKKLLQLSRDINTFETICLQGHLSLQFNFCSIKTWHYVVYSVGTFQLDSEVLHRMEGGGN